MSAISIGQIVFYAVVLSRSGFRSASTWPASTRPRAASSRAASASAALERGFYRLVRTDPTREQDWKSYAKTVVVFSAVFSLVLYALLRLQGHLFLNPDGLPGVPSHISLNTTASFVTNTNWQYYGGEYTMSYLSQMAGLAVQNFVSAAVGMAVLVAVIRGFTRRSSKTLGNFWQDLYRSLAYILLPLSLILAIALISQGVPQTFDGAATATTLEGAEQSIARGPVASQIAIKQLGTNGGGFYNSNSAVPFENPNGLTNFLEMLAILLIPAGQVFMFGKMVGARRAGLRGLRGHVRDVRDRRRGDHAARAAGLAGAARPRASTSTRGTARAAGTWPTRRCASGSPTRPSGRSRRRTPRTARSTAATTRSPRAAEPCPS